MLVQNLLTLAQSPTKATPTALIPWWQTLLDHGFLLIILLTFVTAIVTVLVRQRRKDKCLKLMDDYHVSYTNTNGSVRWGNLAVYSNGLELIFDAPYRTGDNLFKTSAIIYEAEMANCLALCRPVDALTKLERQYRQQQIRHSFQPNPVRRLIRWGRNLLNTLHDAFSKAMGTLIGQLSKANRGTALPSYKGGLEQIGQTLLGAAGNAYEPILERHIGKPVVLQLACPSLGESKSIEIPGFLVDYSDQFIAVFNVEHQPLSDEQLELTESMEGPHYHVELAKESIKVKAIGPEVLIVKSIRTANRYAELQVALTPGSVLELRREVSEKVSIHLQRTRRIDIVCPRNQAIILFGGKQDDALKSQFIP